ncbi:diguanylate cyclase [Spirulina subsalsa FACHB-351]|uniref:Diguanylate cyclase n=2 Tax=Spirulina subsalsa TaxID=54311 RepID=A0ABT3L486_9CYAN|nr:diguanylate cyclase [Spirulina subsalsa FACHB-351]
MEQQLVKQTVVTWQEDWASFWSDPATTLHSFQEIFNSMEDGVILFNPAQNALLVNQAATALLGPDLECLSDPSSWGATILTEVDCDPITYGMNFLLVRFFRGQEFEGEEIEVESGIQGKRVWLRLNSRIFRDAAGHLQGGVMICRDISHYKEVEERLIHDAYHDKLTGLGNRQLLLEHLNRAIAYHKQDQEYHFAVLCLDIDRFKVINDSLGHVVGDRLLRAMTRRLEACLREDDVIVRLGGDEFAILLENIQEVTCAMQVAQRIHQTLTHPFCLEEQEIFTDVSIGIAVNNTHYSYAEEMVRDADIALVHAKKLGLSTYQVFEPKMHSHTVELLQIENDLRRAVENKDLRVYYQPIINLSNREITGFETLVRWQHQTRGFINPDDFIPLAEETGLIIPLGRFVLQNACEKMQQWRSAYTEAKDWVIHVNVSGKQLCQSNFVAELQAILKQTEMLPQNLKLEVTESVFLNQVPRVMEILHELQFLGIQLALDDFGTGYSSLSYLHKLPFKTLKIDRSFIQDLEINNDKLGILRAIVSLATHLGMDVVAEGIETPHQMAQLKALKCEYGQGYLFSKPLDSELMEAWFQAECLSQEEQKACNLRTEVAEQVAQEELMFKIETLAQELEKIKREKEDLEILLETTAQHADLFELELNREILLHEKSKKSLQEKNELLKELCLLDPLTQVANRRHFEQYIQDVWAQLLAEQNPISFILLDVDYFKRFNDYYGHQVGDDCLLKVAQAISQPMRNTTDLVSRYGGEEFAIILPHCGPEGALRVAERIRQELKQLNIPHTESLVSDRLTVSLGIVSTTPSPDSSIQKLIESADQALYSAKLQGRDRYILFSQ